MSDRQEAGITGYEMYGRAPYNNPASRDGRDRWDAGEDIGFSDAEDELLEFSWSADVKFTHWVGEAIEEVSGERVNVRVLNSVQNISFSAIQRVQRQFTTDKDHDISEGFARSANSWAIADAPEFPYIPSGGSLTRETPDWIIGGTHYASDSFGEHRITSVTLAALGTHTLKYGQTETILPLLKDLDEAGDE
jgi:hypothetical protein